MLRNPDGILADLIFKGNSNVHFCLALTSASLWRPMDQKRTKASALKLRRWHKNQEEKAAVF